MEEDDDDDDETTVCPWQVSKFITIEMAIKKVDINKTNLIVSSSKDLFCNVELLTSDTWAKVFVFVSSCIH